MVYEQIERLLDIQLDDNIRTLIEQNVRILHFPAGFTVLHEGDRSTCLYVILFGVVRGYYVDNQGNDITKCFSMENGIFSSEGLRTKNPSSFTIECLEDCKCIKISYDLLYRIMELNKEIRQTIDSFFPREVGKLEYRCRDFAMKNAEERYRLFCEEFPDLHNRVALKYIASYIGVRTSSLSRIRKNLKNNVLN